MRLHRPSDHEVSAHLVSRRQANRADHVDWLAGVTAGVTALDLFAGAAGPEGARLNSLKLRRLLRAMGHGPSTTTRLLRLISVRTASAQGRTTAEPTVGWLVDHKANGRRVAAWADVIGTARHTEDGRAIPPWPGFPFQAVATLPLIATHTSKLDIEPEDDPWSAFPKPTKRPTVRDDPWDALPDLTKVRRAS